MAGFESAGGGDISTDSLWAATGDIAVATGDDAASVLSIGGSSAVLNIECGTPAWTTTPSLAGLTATGDITTTGAAIDWDLKDNCSSALSFDSACKAGILTLVTTDCGEGVTMSGTLGVTGVLTATGGIELSHACQNTLTGSSGCLSIQGNVVYRAGGTDVPVADGGTGLSCLTTGSVLIGTGTSDVTLVAMTTKGHLLGGDGSGAPRALAVGSNCQVLTACSSEDTGMKWACASGGGVTNVAGSSSLVVVNECAGNVDFRVESCGNANALVIDAALVGGVGVMGLGGAVSCQAQVYINYPATTAVACSEMYRLRIDNTAAITVPSGTSAMVASLKVEEPNITETGTLTTGATVYIQDAPTEGANNYSLFVDSGHVRFDDVTIVGDPCAVTSSAIPFNVKANSGHNNVDLRTYSHAGAGIQFQTFERGSGGASGCHSYVSTSAVPIMRAGGANSRGGVVYVHGEIEGNTTVFHDMVVVPVTGGFSNNNYVPGSCAAEGSGNVIYRLPMRGSPAARTYSLGAHNTLYLAMASGNYNVVTYNHALYGLGT